MATRDSAPVWCEKLDIDHNYVCEKYGEQDKYFFYLQFLPPPIPLDEAAVLTTRCRKNRILHYACKDALPACDKTMSGTVHTTAITPFQ